MKCARSGFGIIHWTTRPLDLYFKSLANQVWMESKNEALQATCRRMAADLVGEEQAVAFGKYLHAWVTTMPKIGRETTDFFIDHELKDLAEVEAEQRKRLDLLAAVDRTRVKPAGNDWLEYYAGLEQYVLDVYHTGDAFNRAKKEYADGNLKAARKTIGACRPEQVIDHYARFSQHGGLTRVERGLIVSMNLRWLPHYVRFRQLLAVTPARYNFAPTSHDPLAQSRGVFTFHFGPTQKIRQCLGEEETEKDVFTLPDGAVVTAASGAPAEYLEICRSGIRSEGPIEWTIRPILTRGGKLPAEVFPAGSYELTLLLLTGPEPSTTASEVRVASFARSSSADAEPAASLREDRCVLPTATNRAVRLVSRLELNDPAAVQLRITPVEGELRVCGAVLKPVQ